MQNIRQVGYAHLNNKVEEEWKSLAFGRRGTYNPATGKKGQGVSAFQPGTTSPGALPGSPAFRAGFARRRNAVAAER
jgi:hypothetical protein